MLRIVFWCAYVAVVDGRCLSDGLPAEERDDMPFRGRMQPIKIVRGTWPSASMGGHMLQIIFEEKLGYNTRNNTMYGSSPQGARSVSGCVVEGGVIPRCWEDAFKSARSFEDPQNLAWEIWPAGKAEALSIGASFAFKRYKPTVIPDVGYLGVEGAFVREEMVLKSQIASSGPVDYFRSYNNSHYKPAQFFSKVSDLMSNPMVKYQLSKCDQKDAYNAFASFANKIAEHFPQEKDNTWKYDAKMNVAMICPNEYFWQSPACQANINDCVPFITGEFAWGAPLIFMQSVYWNMPIAVGYAGGNVETWTAWANLSLTQNVLHYWYTPDATFVKFNPQLLKFPDYNKDQYDQGLRVTQTAGAVLSLMTSAGFAKAAPLAFQATQEFKVTHQTMMALLAEQQSLVGTYDQKSYMQACSYLRNNRNIWEKYVPSRTLCQDDEGVVTKTGVYLAGLIFENGTRVSGGVKSGAAKCVKCPPGKYSTSHAGEIMASVLNTCEACAAGTYSASPDGNKQCLECSVGQFQSVSGSSACRPCAPGSYASLVKQASCSDCGVGNFSGESGLSACVACTLGTFLNVTGKSICDKCAMGKYNGNLGATACQECQVGRAAAEPGKFKCELCESPKYTDGIGQTACKNCPKGGFATKNGMTYCEFCPSGRTTEVAVTSADSCNCTEGTYRLADDSCAQCPVGMTCMFGSEEKYIFDSSRQNAPRLKPGFWSATTDPLYVYECNPRSDCPGGFIQVCNEVEKPLVKRSGLVCGQCAEGWRDSGDGCTECTGGDSAGIAIGLLICALFPLTAYYGMQHLHFWKVTVQEATGITIEMIIETGQVASAFASIDIPWTGSIDGLIGSLAVFTVDLGAFMPAPCLTASPEVWRTYTFSVVLIPVVILVIFIEHFAVFKNTFIPVKYRWQFPMTANVASKIFNTIFISQISLGLAPMICYTHPNGKKSIVDYPTQICEGGDYGAIVVVGVISVLIAFGFLGYLFFELHRAPQMLAGPQAEVFTRRMTFAFEDFRSDAYYFNLYMKFMELFIAIVPVVRPDDPMDQVLLFVVLLLISMVIIGRIFPFKIPLLNLVVLFIYSCMVLTLCCAPLFLEDVTPEKRDEIGTVMMILATLGLLSICVMLPVLIVNKFVAPKQIFWPFLLMKYPNIENIELMYEAAMRLNTDQFDKFLRHAEIYRIKDIMRVLPTLASFAAKETCDVTDPNVVTSKKTVQAIVRSYSDKKKVEEEAAKSNSNPNDGCTVFKVQV